jgi:hypothetical protein
MRTIGTVILLLITPICMLAQHVTDSVYTAPEDSVRIITDTIHAHTLLNTTQSEALLESYLLQLLEEQGQRLHTDANPTHLAIHKEDTSGVVEPIPLSALYNPLCIELIFKPLNLSIAKPNTPSIHPTPPPATALEIQTKQSLFSEEDYLCELRDKARSYLTGHSADLYAGTFQDLPRIESLHKKHLLQNNPKLLRLGKADKLKTKSLEVTKICKAKWLTKASALLQFSQNYVSKNWYKGGNSNIAILGIAEGSIKYDNHKNIQWENTGEWRAGFNSVNGDTLRKISTSDDLLRLQSKLGFKAFNKFYYTGAVEFQTQFFNTYKEINSTVLKSSTFAPVRLNISLGLDYKPDKNLSIMFAPVSYKFIYVKDTTRIDQTQYGVKEDKRSLNEIGSSIKIIYNYQPVDGIQLDGRFYFYTNYQKVEVELELVANFIINRYLSARFSLYPRYDNTAILPNKEKAQIQFKEFLSVGFSHKFTQAGKMKRKTKKTPARH